MVGLKVEELRVAVRFNYAGFNGMTQSGLQSEVGFTGDKGRLRAGSVRVVRAASVAALALFLGGCGLSSLTSGIGSSVFGNSDSNKQAEVQSVTEEQLLSAAKADGPDTGPITTTGAVAHGCPKVSVPTSDRDLTIYEQGRAGDGLAIMHRGEITKTARECIIEPGKVTVKYGFSGKVLLGPKGKPGPVSLPVRVAVVDANRAQVVGDKVQVNVNMSLEKPIGYFSIVRIIAFNVSEGARPGEYQISLAFDRQQQKPRSGSGT